MSQTHTPPTQAQAPKDTSNVGGSASGGQGSRSGARSDLRQVSGYDQQQALLKPKDTKRPIDPKLAAEITKAARSGGDDDYVRNTITAVHLSQATAAQKAGMIVILLDGFTGNADEAKILFILKESGRDATLAALKGMGHLQWLYDDMHGKEFKQLMALDSTEIRGKSIEDLLSRSVVDWVVTAKECRRVLEILKSVGVKERTQLIGRIISAGLLANFLKNVSAADKAAHVAIISGIPVEQRVNVLLSYQVILDWVVTDAEATEALDLLLAVPAAQVPDVLGRVKLDKLLAELPAKERVRLRPLVDAVTDPAIKAKLMKAQQHGATDTAYSARGSDKTGLAKAGTHASIDARTDDAMAGYAGDLAAASTPADKAVVNARYSGALSDLDHALTKKLALEKANGIYLSATPEQTIYTLPNLERMERLLAVMPKRGAAGVVTPANAPGALALLLGYNVAHLKGFMPWLEVGPLLQSLPAADRSKVKPLHDASTDMGQRGVFYGALYAADADARSGAAPATITEKATIAASATSEIDAEIAIFYKKFEAARLACNGDPAKLAQVNATYKGTLDTLVARKEFELDLEFKYNVNMTDTVATGAATERTWTLKQLKGIQALFDKLPAGHVRDNADVKEIRRDRMKVRGGVEKPGVGGDHSGPLVRVFDTGLNSSYRFTGQTSELAEHTAGQRGPNGPLGALEEVLVHEIGHGVHDANPAAYTAFKAAVGWASHTKAALKTKLQADGKTAAAADTFITELDADRAKHYSSRPEKVYKGRTYSVDPYRGTRYISRDHGSIPSIQDTGASAAIDKQYGYARSNEADHFAEVYMQLAEVPETAYRNLVATPTAKHEAANTAFVAKQNEHTALVAATPPNRAAIASARRAMDAAKTKRDTEKKKMDAQVGQWTIMRNDIYDADAAEAPALAAVTTAAAAVPAGVKRATALGYLATFRTKMKMCGTPYQIEQLKNRTVAEIGAL